MQNLAGMIALLAVIGIAVPVAAQPSFDCAKAESSAEALICVDETLQALDREISRLYDLAVDGPHMTPARLRELQAIQRGWIKGRDDCWKAVELRECVVDSYMIRIHEIRTGYSDSREEDENGISLGPFASDCNTGYGIGVTFVNTGESYVYLEWSDQYRVLEGGPSASGVRYVRQYDGMDTVFWTHQGAARFSDMGGPELTCTLEEPG